MVHKRHFNGFGTVSFLVMGIIVVSFTDLFVNDTNNKILCTIMVDQMVSNDANMSNSGSSLRREETNNINL